MPRKELHRLCHNPTGGDNGMKADAGSVCPRQRQTGCSKRDSGERRNIRRCRDALCPGNIRNRHKPHDISGNTFGNSHIRHIAAHSPQGRPKGRLPPYGKAAYLHRPAARKLQNRMLQGEKESLYDTLHHRLNGVVRDFVIEARAVAVGCAAEMLHLDRGIRRLQSAD